VLIHEKRKNLFFNPPVLRTNPARNNHATLRFKIPDVFGPDNIYSTPLVVSHGLHEFSKSVGPEGMGCRRLGENQERRSEQPPGYKSRQPGLERKPDHLVRGKE
jgi:hypothetical protein